MLKKVNNSTDSYIYLDNEVDLSQIKETVIENNDVRRRYRWQIGMFFLTYVGYMVIHVQREFWAFSKKDIEEKNKDFTKEKLTGIDTANLTVYAISIYFTGRLSDIYCPRKVLSFCYLMMCVLSGLLTLAGLLNWYSEIYFYIVQMVIGAVTSLAYPANIGIMGNWSSKSNRGLFIGFWATCPNIGNIAGQQLAGLILSHTKNWGYLMVTVSGLFLLDAICMFLLLEPFPAAIGIEVKELTAEEERVQNKLQGISKQEEQKITLLQAIKIPKVLTYAFTFFFIKLVVNNLLYQLPIFLEKQFAYTPDQAADANFYFDLGAVLGSLIMGAISDKMYGKRSPVCFVGVLVALGMSLLITLDPQIAVKTQNQGFIAVLFFFGFTISGLANIVAGSCSADLGKQQALKANAKATSTVTGIIDGTGSLGSAFGALVLSYSMQIKDQQIGLWGVVSLAVFLTLIPVSIILRSEVREIRQIYQIKRQK